MEQTAMPTAATLVRLPISAEQLVEISQDDTHRYELFRGKVYTMPFYGARQGAMNAHLGATVIGYALSQNLGEGFAPGTGFLLERTPDTVLAPALSLIRTPNLTPKRMAETFVPGAPDLVVEVLSPSDTATRTAVKVQTWLRHGAQLVWVVEPESETVTVYRADGSVALLKPGSALDGEQVLPGFAYPLDRLFR